MLAGNKRRKPEQWGYAELTGSLGNCAEFRRWCLSKTAELVQPAAKLIIVYQRLHSWLAAGSGLALVALAKANFWQGITFGMSMCWHKGETRSATIKEPRSL